MSVNVSPWRWLLLGGGGEGGRGGRIQAMLTKQNLGTSQEFVLKFLTSTPVFLHGGPGGNDKLHDFGQSFQDVGRKCGRQCRTVEENVFRCKSCIV